MRGYIFAVAMMGAIVYIGDSLYCYRICRILSNISLSTVTLQEIMSLTGSSTLPKHRYIHVTTEEPFPPHPPTPPSHRVTGLPDHF